MQKKNKKDEDDKKKEEVKKAKNANVPVKEGKTKEKEVVEVDPTKYFDNRKALINDIKASGVNPFPHKFAVSITNPQFIEKFTPITKKGEFLEDCPISVAGRVHTIRNQSAGLIFYDIYSDNKKVQIYCNAK